jgi:hypothetical protein
MTIAQVNQLVCPNDGASLRFDPGTKILQCRYCGGHFAREGDGWVPVAPPIPEDEEPGILPNVEGGKTNPRWTLYAATAAAVVVGSWVVWEFGIASPRIAPEVDAALSRYETAHDRAVAIAATGARCSDIASAFAELTAKDLAVAQNGALTSTKRQDAIRDGENCRRQLELSDTRFRTLSDAVVAADNKETAEAVQAVIRALSQLDSFDQSRPATDQEKNVIAKAKTYADRLSASDARLASFLNAAKAFSTDQSPEAHVRFVDAFGQLTDFDLDRVHETQSVAIASAERAAAAIQKARSYLESLPGLVRKAQSGIVAGSEEALVEAVVGAGTFAQAVATPAQRQSYEQARAIAIPLGWSLLRQRIAAVDQTANAQNVQAAAAIYARLKDGWTGPFTAEQKGLLAKGRDADSQISQSNGRLKDLLSAVADWQQQGVAAGATVLVPFRAITAFDQSRFGADERAAWNRLSQADVILNGSSRGLNATTKGTVRILVASTVASQVDNAVAKVLGSRLGAKGFMLASDAKDAALRVQVTVTDTNDLAKDLTSGFMAYATNVQLQITATWIADGAVLMSERFTGAGRGTNGELARVDARSNAIDLAVAGFSAMAD